MCPRQNFWDVAGNANFESLVLEDVRPCRWAKDARCERYFPDNGALDLEQRIVGAHAQIRLRVSPSFAWPSAVSNRTDAKDA